jgi:lipoate---protein ligase
VEWHGRLARVVMAHSRTGGTPVPLPKIAQSVKYLDLTFQTPEENLACDEALLDWCDEGEAPEVLRFWEPQHHFVVVGYSNRIEREVYVATCRDLGIPTLRRCTGGGAVVQGPGCLSYALILRMESDPSLQSVTGTNHFVMERNRAALEKLLAGSSGRQEALSSPSALRTPHSAVKVRGHTDLAFGDRKFSGNAQRRRRRALLFHGTFLLNFDLALVSELLTMPSKQPDYRQSRGHAQFLINLPAAANVVKAALRQTWKAVEDLKDFPSEQIRNLAAQKYSTEAWSLRL